MNIWSYFWDPPKPCKLLVLILTWKMSWSKAVSYCPSWGEGVAGIYCCVTGICWYLKHKERLWNLLKVIGEASLCWLTPIPLNSLGAGPVEPRRPVPFVWASGPLQSRRLGLLIRADSHLWWVSSPDHPHRGPKTRNTGKRLWDFHFTFYL